MGRLNFYINRAGSNLEVNNKERLEAANDKLTALYDDASLQPNRAVVAVLDNAEETDMRTPFENPFRTGNALDAAGTVSMKIAYDANGNKVVKISTEDGAFSIQTNGNLPSIQRKYMKGDSVPLTDEKALAEINEYVSEYGTPRQKKIIAGFDKYGALDSASNSPDLDNPAYAFVGKVKGRTMTAIRALTAADGAKVLRQANSEWTKSDHAKLAAQHLKMAEELDDEWMAVVSEQFKKQFGRDYSITDYKVSGVARSEFPSSIKDRLREINGMRNDHKSLAAAHEYASKHYRDL